MNILVILYSIVLVGLALYGFNALYFSVMFLRRRHDFRRHTSTPPMTDFPAVTVQLPIFNERLVVERLIDAVAALDYPADKLSIQVLDDSTDETMHWRGRASPSTGRRG